MNNIATTPTEEAYLNNRILKELRDGLLPILEMGCSCAVDISPFYSSDDTQNSFWRGVYAFSANSQDHSRSRKLLSSLLSESYASIKCYFNLYLHPLMTFLKVNDEVKNPVHHEEILPSISKDDIQTLVEKLQPQIDSVLKEVIVGNTDISSISIGEASCSYFFDSNCNKIESLIISENAKARRARVDEIASHGVTEKNIEAERLHVGNLDSYDKLRMDYLSIARLQHMTLRECYEANNQSIQFIYPLNSSSVCQQAKPIDFFDDAMDDSYLGGIWIYVFEDGAGNCIEEKELVKKRSIIKSVINSVVNALRLEIVPTLFRAKMRFAEIRENRRLREAYTQSAIGSIMSRNGSHNIGSHVLAALADNVGTMPDDKVLYQYIQHRMDYIATATTEFPTWRQPTMFLGNMMKNFLSQRYLLDNIAGSEGLKAWKFQGRVANRKNNTATIKFRIRKKLDTKSEPIEILTDFDNEGSMNLAEDISLAIPAGTVGQHAFFTIIENVIRNAAKHDWSSPPETTRKIKFPDDGGTGNLVVYIDFKDIPEKGNVEFTIYTNMSDADEKSNGEISQTLYERIDDSFRAQFIDEKGKLRKENWGIAEMKISAGYLQTRELGVIGGLEGTSPKAIADNNRFGEDIIVPVKIQTSEQITEKKDGKVKTREVKINHLGYKFSVPKTRTLLIVTKVKPVELNEARAGQLATWGICIKTEAEVAKDISDNSFEFILVESFTKDHLKWSLPFRVICTSNKERATKLTADWDDTGESVSDIADLLTMCQPEDIDYVAAELLSRVAACWIRYLDSRIRKDFNERLKLVVIPNIDGNGNSSGQSLVNAATAVIFVFEEGFSNVANGFLGLYAVEESMKSKINWLIDKAASENVSESIRQSDGDCRALVKQQLLLWIKDCPDDGLDSIKEFLCAKDEGDHPFKNFVDYVEQACEQAKGYLGKYAERITTLPAKFPARQGKKKNIGEETSSWERYRPDLVLSKYNGDAPVIKYMRHFNPVSGTIRTQEEIEKKLPPSFVTNPFDKLGEGKHVLYIEPLSGTQSYLTQIETKINEDDKIFQAKLVECALMRILIIDERVSRFVGNHSDSMLATLSRMGIFIADDKIVTDALELTEEAKDFSGKPKEQDETTSKSVEYTPKGLVKLDVAGIKSLRKAIITSNEIASSHGCNSKVDFDWLAQRYEPLKNKFDVLIIHQGILDKWFRGVVEDKGKMATLYEELKYVFSYVIITTGRGTPSNIPDMARVLPFSTIETTLFRKYPEKLVLIDAIMNILPHKKWK